MQHKLTLTEIQAGLADKAFSSVELTAELFGVIEKENPEINDFLALNKEQAMEQAAASDARRAEGTTRSPLDGVPYAAKDVFRTKDIPTTAGSKMLQGYVPTDDATPVARLAEAGAVLLGKNNCDEFAMGASGEYSAYGATKNPVDHTRSTGGSSSGSAAAVAAWHAPLTIATDTNGSIRQPAAFCGVLGIKPTYGRISRYGLIALMSSADHVGTFTHTAQDAAAALEVLAGADPKDATSSREEVASYTAQIANTSLKGLRIGLPKEYYGEGLQPEVSARLKEVAHMLEQQGATIVELSMPHTLDALPTYYILNPAEASSNLARYDGIRYMSTGIPEPAEQMALIERYAHIRGEGFGKEPTRRIIIGNYVLAAEHQDKNFRHASRVRTLIRQDFTHAFKDVDVLLTPATPTVAFKAGAVQDPIEMYLADIYTSAPALAGLPALSVPIGMAAGLPIGAQLVGDAFQEGRLLGVAHHIEQLTRT